MSLNLFINHYNGGVVMKKLLIILAFGGIFSGVRGLESDESAGHLSPELSEGFASSLDLLATAAGLRQIADELEAKARGQEASVPGKHKSGTLHECETCHKRIRGKQNYRNHMNSHDTIGKYECPECGEKHRTPSSRTAHRKRVHGVSPFSTD